MKIGDLVTFCPEAWGTPLEDRPLGIIMNVEDYRDGMGPIFTFTMVTAIFPGDDIPYSSNIKDFEVINENW
jgi:hypothetical protein